MGRPEKIRLGDLLVKEGLISVGVLESALAEQKRTGRRLGHVLIDSQLVTEEAIARALSNQLSLPYVDLKVAPIEASALRLLGESQARRLRVIPLRLSDDRLTVGMTDPGDLFAYDELVRLTGRQIQIAVVTEGDLLGAYDRHYRNTEEITGYTRELEQSLKDDDDALLDAISGEAGGLDAPVARLVQSVFEDALQVRASDIHIEPHERKLRIRFRIDGVLHSQTEADLTVASALAMRLKIMSGLDISEKRLPQDGRFQMTVKGRVLDVRLSTLPTQYGESMAMRLLAADGGLVDLDNIGMPPAMLARYRDIIARPNGLVLVTGPTGSGKTTTLYASMAAVNSPDRKLITVEDPVEYRLPGLMQVQVNDKIDMSFARALRSILRQDPDVVLVGEMRDSETAQIGLRAAVTGHLVFSSLHTNDAVSTPVRLLDMGAPRYMVATALQAVIAQRLVRQICWHCPQPHAVTATEAAWLGRVGIEGSGALAFHAGAGCPQCNHTGYRGRLGVYEMLEMTPALAAAANQADPGEFLAAARAAMAGQTLAHSALALAAAGKTTLAEAIRISNQTDE
ncbi:MAG: GspE/PulE family protein [Immundisolibacter sp.]|uniref:GspE/PulE family protein n=1 Tax=Immundisolibacter sp. TaxID=1934948 RepID=UPI003D102D5A